MSQEDKPFIDESAHIFKHARDSLQHKNDHDGKYTIELVHEELPQPPEVERLMKAARVEPKPKTVLDFGARGSPHDDTEAFKKAIAASKKSKTKVVVPEGEFTIHEEMEFKQLHFIGTVRFA